MIPTQNEVSKDSKIFAIEVIKFMSKLMCTNHDEVNKSEVDSHPWNRLLNSPFYTGFILINSDKVYAISFKSYRTGPYHSKTNV